MPGPLLVRPPVPVIVAFARVTLLVLLKTNVPLLVIVVPTTSGKLPFAPPLPICKVPPLMVVPPFQELAVPVRMTVPAVPVLVSRPVPPMEPETVKRCRRYHGGA